MVLIKILGQQTCDHSLLSTASDGCYGISDGYEASRRRFAEKCGENLKDESLDFERGSHVACAWMKWSTKTMDASDSQWGDVRVKDVVW